MFGSGKRFPIKAVYFGLALTFGGMMLVGPKADYQKRERSLASGDLERNRIKNDGKPGHDSDCG
jgi:hypothetical protein